MNIINASSISESSTCYSLIRTFHLSKHIFKARGHGDSDKQGCTEGVAIFTSSFKGAVPQVGPVSLQLTVGITTERRSEKQVFSGSLLSESPWPRALKMCLYK